MSDLPDGMRSPSNDQKHTSDIDTFFREVLQRSGSRVVLDVVAHYPWMPKTYSLPDYRWAVPGIRLHHPCQELHRHVEFGRAGPSALHSFTLVTKLMAALALLYGGEATRHASSA